MEEAFKRIDAEMAREGYATASSSHPYPRATASGSVGKGWGRKLKKRGQPSSKNVNAMSAYRTADPAVATRRSKKR